MTKLVVTNDKDQRKAQREILKTVFGDRYNYRNHDKLVEEYNNSLIQTPIFEEVVQEVEVQTEEPVIENKDKTLFHYEMVSRPFGIGCQPKNNVNYEEKSKILDGCWGVVSYDRELTNEEVRSFELRPLQEQKTEKIEEQKTDVFSVGNEIKFMGKLRTITSSTNETFTIDSGVEFNKETLVKIGGKGFPYEKAYIVNEEEKETLRAKTVPVKKVKEKKVVDASKLTVGSFVKYMGKSCEVVAITDEMITIDYSNNKFSGQIDFNKETFIKVGSKGFGYEKISLIDESELEELSKNQKRRELLAKVKQTAFGNLTNSQLQKILNIINNG